MKKKENLSLGRKNLVVLLVTLVLVISSILTGCGISTATTTPETKQEVAAVDKETVQAEVEETKQEEAVQETTEDIAQSTEEVQGPQSLSEWAQTVDVTEPKLTVWNDDIKEGIILENGQKHILRAGDILVLCINEKESGLVIDTPISSKDFEAYGTSNYKIFEFYKEFLEETLFGFTITISGTDYSFSVTLVSENSTATASEGSESNEMSGKDWASGLSYEEPKLLVWNDEIGTKEIIENGGQYTMNQGDVLAIHCPAEHYVTTGTPIEFAKGVTLGSNFWKLDYVLPSESQEINLEIGVLNPDGEMENLNYVITTP